MSKFNPNFIIGGGVASGTSFLSATLINHPEIYLPIKERPEPNFFHYSWKYNQGLNWWLNECFFQVQDEKAIGERSSLLLTSSKAPERIYKHFPDMKLIFCLRNPIERAWANYRFSVLEGLEPLTFLDALSSENDRIRSAVGKWQEVQPNAYVARSKYSKQLEKYISFFSKENILILKSEDLSKNTNANLRKVCDFLGVSRITSLQQPPNYSSPSVKNPVLQSSLRGYFGDRFSEIIEHIRKEIEIPSQLFTHEDLDKISLLKSNLESSKSSLKGEERALLLDLLEDELISLKNVLDFPIDDWK
jgi:hypothetical protein